MGAEEKGGKGEREKGGKWELGQWDSECHRMSHRFIGLRIVSHPTNALWAESKVQNKPSAGNSALGVFLQDFDQSDRGGR